MEKITEEDLILYLYQEATPKKKAAIEEALTVDLGLNDRLQVLKRTLKQLDDLKLKSPSRESLSIIDQHAKASNRIK